MLVKSLEASQFSMATFFIPTALRLRNECKNEIEDKNKKILSRFINRLFRKIDYMTVLLNETGPTGKIICVPEI